MSTAKVAGMRLIRRDEWGARPPKSVVPIAHSQPESWVHHTAGEFSRPPKWTEKLFRTKANAYVRAIQNYHMDTRNYADIAYTYMLFKMYGFRRMHVYELRGFGVQGGHTLNHNSISYGFCLAGNFDVTKLTKRDVRYIRSFFDWAHSKKALKGRRMQHPTGGHQDTEGASTACPGQYVMEHMTEFRIPLKRRI